MLTDIERKVLRILYNDTRAGGKVPSINKLVVRTGKTPDDVQRVLRSLTDQQYIDWSPDRHNKMQVIKPWEDRMMPAAKLLRASNEYWDKGH